MAHILKLGFKQSPSGTDDYIDLGGSTNVSGKGYHLLSYKEGPVYLDVFGHQVRDLTIVLDVDGSNVVNALANYRAINHYIQQTRMFLAPFQGNYAAATDGTWFSGFAATLTFQPQNATGPIFWDVLDGNVEMTEAFLGPDILGSRLSNVVVTLTVSYTARGALVTMNNLVAMGSFEPPFNPADSYFRAGWTFDTAANWSLDTTTSVYGANSLKWVSTASGSNEAGYSSESDDLSNATTVSASVWIRYSSLFSSLSIVLQGFSAGAWGSLNSFGFINSGTNLTWTKYTVSAVSTATVTKVRLAFITNGTGTLWVDGAAIYKGSVLPQNGEYFTHGRTVGFPSAYLYGAAGDVEAPCIIHAGRPTSSTNSLDKYQALIVGAREYNPTTSGRAGMVSMAFMTADGAADTTQFWGKVGHSITTASSVFRFPIVSATNMNPATLRIPRKYRVFLAYTTTGSPVISAVTIYVNTIARPLTLGYFVVNLPTTGGSTFHDLYELGDTVFPPPDFAAANQTLDLTTAVIDLASNGTSATIEVGGVLLIPVEGYATANDLNAANSNTIAFSSMGSPDGSAGRAVYLTTKDYLPASFYDATSKDIANYTVDNIKVIPGDMQFEVLTLASRSGVNSMTNPQYSYDASRAVSVTLVYQPRYLSGGI